MEGETHTLETFVEIDFWAGNQGAEIFVIRSTDPEVREFRARTEKEYEDHLEELGDNIVIVNSEIVKVTKVEKDRNRGVWAKLVMPVDYEDSDMVEQFAADLSYLYYVKNPQPWNH